jgi:polyhydroxyalkanoate synthesis repressor PhaR
MTTAKNSADRLIKKYPNRRLYDTQTSSYITLTDVKQLVLDNEEFTVDAKSGDDLTRSILLQIILEEESHGVPMFSSGALSQIIRYYGHAMQGMMGTTWKRTSRPSSTSRTSWPKTRRASTKASPSAPRCGRSS